MADQHHPILEANILGDLRLQTQVMRTEIKGIIVAARVPYLRQEYGDAAVSQLAATIGDVPHNYVDKPPIPLTWYPLAEVMEFDRAMFAGPMGGRIDGMHGLGLFIARDHLSTVYKMVLKLGSPGFILSRSNMVFSRYFRPGHLEMERIDDNRMHVRFEDGALPLYICDAGVRGFIDAALVLSGCTRVESRHTRCVHRGDRACEWIANWST